LQNPNDRKNEQAVQIEMKPESIIIRIEVYEGVLSETRFEGADSYYKMLNYLKSMCRGENIHAILHIGG
jgi:hypothetical protein